MQKTLTSTAVLLAAGMMLAGNVLAQQVPPSNTTSKPATTTKSTTAGTATKKTTTAKTAAKTAEVPLDLSTEKAKRSYAVGTDIGQKLHESDMDVDTAVLTRALKDAFAGKKSQMTEEEIRTTLTGLASDMRKKAMEKQQAEALKNKKAGDDYRAVNKTKEGVVTLPDGLQYKILQAGTGPKPTTSDSVVCNYKGTFVDGKEFDSSYKRGQPATFPVTGVIKGWTEALQMMPVGSKWQLVIPPDLAYGEQGRGPSMPGNSTLVFEVELVKIAEKTPPPAAPAASQPSSETKPSTEQSKPQ